MKGLWLTFLLVFKLIGGGADLSQPLRPARRLSTIQPLSFKYYHSNIYHLMTIIQLLSSNDYHPIMFIDHSNAFIPSFIIPMLLGRRRITARRRQSCRLSRTPAASADGTCVTHRDKTVSCHTTMRAAAEGQCVISARQPKQSYARSQPHTNCHCHRHCRHQPPPPPLPPAPCSP